MEDVRFRGPVRPGDRLMLVGKGEKVRRRQTVFDAQGFVDARMVFHREG
jgi:3-hydroxyacyl-[acyl-carrier-protein] dehydratase